MLGYYRLLAAVGVLMAHVGGFVSDGVSRAMVSAFFIVSGYLMALTLSQNYGANPLPFYWNRFLRLYPVHTLIATTTFVLAPGFVVLRMGGLPPDQYIPAFMETLLLAFDYQQVVGPTKGMLIGPAWTLPYEILFYLFAPLIFGLRVGRIPCGVVIYAAISVGYVAVNGSLTWLLQPFALGYDNPAAIYVSFVMFAFGGLLYSLKPLVFHKRYQRVLEWLGIALLLLIIISGTRYFAPDGRAFDANYGMAMGVGTYLATALILLGWQQQQSKSSKLAGDLTYPVYLIHWPIIHAGLFDYQFIRERIQFFSHLFHLGDYVFIAVSVLLLSLGLGYMILWLEKKLIYPHRAGTKR